jgi:branched-chain amino acid transport system substrate-binding protein
MYRISLLVAASAALTLGVFATNGNDSAPVHGVAPDKIHIGQSCALKGPAAALGSGMQAGLNAYFQRVNKQGGIDGRQIELESVNDGYEPEQCTNVTKMLIEKSDVFLLIGEIGTPTSKVALPLCTEAKVPFVAPFTGAELLRSPFNRYAVNVRASYFQETEQLAKLLVDGRGAKKVACFFQNDAFGQAGLTGITNALERRKMQLCAKGQFERNTVAVATGLADVAAGAPDVILMVGPYKPIAAFVKAARQNEATKNATFCTISFVGSMELLNELGPDSEGVIISQVVPFPWDTSVPVVADYQADMKTCGAEKSVGFTSLEGYLSAKFFCQACDAIEGAPTREGFLDTIQKTGSFDLGGFTLKFGSEDNQGSDTVWMTVFNGGKVVPLK